MASGPTLLWSDGGRCRQFFCFLKKDLITSRPSAIRGRNQMDVEQRLDKVERKSNERRMETQDNIMIRHRMTGQRATIARKLDER